jgi:prepilin-type N-terminal cleavage/methylation domain-containing protein
MHPSRQNPFPNRSGAFTLVELLTVIAIIAVLAVLILTVTGKIRESAGLVKSTQRQRSLGVHFAQYATDFNDAFPNAAGTSSFAGGRWPFYFAQYMPPYKTTWAAGGYVNGIVGSWDDFRRQEIFHDTIGFNPKVDSALGIWGYNLNLCDREAVRRAQITDPTKFPVLANSQPDISGLHLEWGGPSPLAKQRGWTGPTKPRGPAPLRGTKSLFLFADWHVENVEICDPEAWPWNDPEAFTVR